jgi:eukaryotic-like serine/threonine-protein kinase
MIQFNSLFGFFAFGFIIAGAFLFLAGSGIIHWESLSVEKGKKTLGIGALFLILGIVFFRLEIAEQERLANLPNPTPVIATTAPELETPTPQIETTITPVAPEPEVAAIQVEAENTPATPEFTPTPAVTPTSSPTPTSETPATTSGDDVLVVGRYNLQRTGDSGQGVEPRLTGERWRASLEGLPIYSDPILANGILYLANGNTTTSPSYFYALNASNGRQIWQATLESGGYSAATFYRDKIFVGDSSGTIYAFDALTGDEVWRFPAGGVIYASPTILGDQLYLGNTQGTLYALDIEEGLINKSFQLGQSGESAIVRTASVANDMLYVVAGPDLYKIDPATNELELLYSLDGYYFYSIAIREDIIYGVAESRAPEGEEKRVLLYALTLNGDDFWQMPYEIKGWWTGSNHGHLATVHSEPAVSATTVLLGTAEGVLYAVDRYSGQELWSFETESDRGGIRGASTIVNNTVYFGSWPDYIYGLDIETGEQVYRYTIPTGLDAVWFGDVLIVDGILYVGTGNGYVFAIP